MNPLPWWIRLLLWCCGATVVDLVEEVTPLQLHLRRLDITLAVALGSARINPHTGGYERLTGEWRQ